MKVTVTEAFDLRRVERRPDRAAPVFAQHARSQRRIKQEDQGAVGQLGVAARSLLSVLLAGFQIADEQIEEYLFSRQNPPTGLWLVETVGFEIPRFVGDQLIRPEMAQTVQKLFEICLLRFSLNGLDKLPRAIHLGKRNLPLAAFLVNTIRSADAGQVAVAKSQRRSEQLAHQMA